MLRAYKSLNSQASPGEGGCVFRFLKPLSSLPKVMGRQPNCASACRTWSLELNREMLVSQVDSGPPRDRSLH